MSADPHEPEREPLEVERLLPTAKRVTIGEFQAWRESIATPPAVDELDLLVEEIRRAEFEGKGARP